VNDPLVSLAPDAMDAPAPDVEELLRAALGAGQRYGMAVTSADTQVYRRTEAEFDAAAAAAYAAIRTLGAQR
jgi:hypothetical protein